MSSGGSDRRRPVLNDDKDDAAIADTAARTYAQSGYRGAVVKIIEMQFCFSLFYDGNLAFETGMAGEHRPRRFACYCGVTEAPAQPRYSRVSRLASIASTLTASGFFFSEAGVPS